MDPKTFKLAELIMVFGGVLALGVWQLISINRELKKDKAKSTDDQDPPET